MASGCCWALVRIHPDIVTAPRRALAASPALLTSPVALAQVATTRTPSPKQAPVARHIAEPDERSRTVTRSRRSDRRVDGAIGTVTARPSQQTTAPMMVTVVMVTPVLAAATWPTLARQAGVLVVTATGIVTVMLSGGIVATVVTVTVVAAIGGVPAPTATAPLTARKRRRGSGAPKAATASAATSRV
jgi:hypothetical protein